MSPPNPHKTKDHVFMYECLCERALNVDWKGRYNTPKKPHFSIKWLWVRSSRNHSKTKAIYFPNNLQFGMALQCPIWVQVVSPIWFLSDFWARSLKQKPFIFIKFRASKQGVYSNHKFSANIFHLLSGFDPN